LEGPPNAFELLFADGSKVKADVPMRPTVDETKGAILSCYRHRFPGVSADSVVLCSTNEVIHDDEPAIRLTGEIPFVVKRLDLECRVALGAAMWKGQFPGHATIGQVRAKILDEGAMDDNEFCLCIGTLILPDNYVLAFIMHRPGETVFGTKITAINAPLLLGELIVVVQCDILKTVCEFRKLIETRLAFPSTGYVISHEDLQLNDIAHVARRPFVIHCRGRLCSA
jgi:hypothetical protein